MKKPFNENKQNNINILVQKEKLKGLYNINKIRNNNSFNNKQSIYFNENKTSNNIYNKISSKLKNRSNQNTKREYGYIFYGNNKIFKTRNKNLFNKIDDNSNNDINIINNFQKLKGIKMNRQLSSDIILNSNNKNFNFSEKVKNKKNNNNLPDKKILGISSFEYFPNIYGLNKRKNENDLNINFLFNENNKGIKLEELNQLHKNFINSIKNNSGIFSEKEINYNSSSEFNSKNNITKTKKNNYFEFMNSNQKWFNSININNNENKEEKENNKFVNNNKLLNNNHSSSKNIEKKLEINRDKFMNISNYNKKKESNSKNEKIKNKNLILNKNELNDINNKINFNNKKNIIKKSNSIKLDIKKYLKDKQKILDKKESTSSSLYSINFSKDDENNEINSKNESKSIKYNSQFNKENIINNNKTKSIFSKFDNIDYRNNISKLFNFTSKDKNFSYQSTKNMKIEEKNNKDDINNKDGNNDNNSRNREDEEKSNAKYNFKTSTYFFSPKFKNDEKNKKNKKDNNNTNIKEIINNVIENNKKAAEARVSTSFYNIGKNFLNNKMRDSQKNFYSSNNKKSYAWGGDTNYTKEQAKEEMDSKKDIKKTNSIQLTLLSPSEWEKHEEVWISISNKKYNIYFENFFLPPNDTDILISSYLKMFPNKLNICNYSKINPVSKKEKGFLSFYIDDDIQNPKNEIKKWKTVYKKMIFRWHPDKLFPLLNELNIKNEYIIKELQRRSSLIINNINVLYQNIMEILKKIVLCKEKKDSNNK